MKIILTSAAISFAVISTGAQAVSISTDSSAWQEVYNGYGTITYSASNGVTMQPKAATSKNETHAALTLAKMTVTNPVKDFTITLQPTTIRQLRTGSTPNPWEVFWLFFNYTDNNGSKRTNYIIFKPNGAEMGIANDAYQQTYLYTNGSPSLAINQTSTWKIVKQGGTVTAYLNGVKAFSASGAYDAAGAIGLYCEDSLVNIKNIDLESGVTPAPAPSPSPAPAPSPTPAPAPAPSPTPSPSPVPHHHKHQVLNPQQDLFKQLGVQMPKFPGW